MKSLKSLILRKNTNSFLLLIFVIVPIVRLSTPESYLNNYRNETNHLKITIPIIRKLNYVEKTKDKTQTVNQSKKFLLDKISDENGTLRAVCLCV